MFQNETVKISRVFRACSPQGFTKNDLEIHINNFFEKNTLKDIVYRVNRNQTKELN